MGPNNSLDWPSHFLVTSAKKACGLFFLKMATILTMCEFCHEKFFSTCENSFVKSFVALEDVVKCEKGTQ